MSTGEAVSDAEAVPGVLTPGTGGRRSERAGAGRNGPSCATCQQAWSGTRAAHCGGCHETFAAVSLFDRHRDHYGEHGRCLDPATITKGSPIVFRDGMWRGPEMDDEAKAKAFGKK